MEPQNKTELIRSYFIAENGSGQDYSRRWLEYIGKNTFKEARVEMGKKIQKTWERLKEDRRENVKEKNLGNNLNGANRSLWVVRCEGDSSERHTLS